MGSECVGLFYYEIPSETSPYNNPKTNTKKMEPQETDQPHTLCPKCNNFILTPNFLIHEARCKGNNRQSSTYTRNSRISGIRNSQNGRTSDVEGEGERIPCPFCGYGQTLKELDTHPQVCPHRETECQLCRLKFPLSLMEQHELVCTSRQRSLPSRQTQQNRNPQQPQPNRNQPQVQIQSSNRGPERQQERPTQPQPNLNYPNIPSYADQNRNNNRNNRNRIIQEVEEDDEALSPGTLRLMERRRDMRDSPLDLLRMMMGGMGQGMGGMGMGQRNMFGEDPFEGRTRRVVVIDPGALIALLARRAREGGQAPGLSKQQIKQFPITKYHNHENTNRQQDEDMCAICYCNFEEGQNCLNLSCKHKFHPDCIGKWLEKNPTCPLCKRNFKGQGQGREREQERERPVFFFNRVNLP